MEEILEEVVPSDILKKFEATYNKQLEANEVTKGATFDYACCLVRSRYNADVRKGICLLETLFQEGNEEEKRDYLFYLAIGNTKLKLYPTALRYVRAFLTVEPANLQVQNLEKLIKKKMEQEGLKGIALVGGAALILGGLVSIGVALTRK